MCMHIQYILVYTVKFMQPPLPRPLQLLSHCGRAFSIAPWKTKDHHNVKINTRYSKPRSTKVATKSRNTKRERRGGITSMGTAVRSSKREDT